MKKKEVLLLSIGVFLTVIAWLIADVYHAVTEEKIKSKVEIPNISSYVIDVDVLNALDKKQE